MYKEMHPINVAVIKITDSKSSRHPELQFSLKYSVHNAIYIIKCSITSINCHTTA